MGSNIRCGVRDVWHWAPRSSLSAAGGDVRVSGVHSARLRGRRIILIYGKTPCDASAEPTICQPPAPDAGINLQNWLNAPQPKSEHVHLRISIDVQSTQLFTICISIHENWSFLWQKKKVRSSDQHVQNYLVTIFQTNVRLISRLRNVIR